MTASTGAGGYTLPLTAGSADADTEVFLGLMEGSSLGWEEGPCLECPLLPSGPFSLTL